MMPIKRIASTGSSGFYGRAVIGELRAQYPEAQILGLDVRAPTDARSDQRPDQFILCDILHDDIAAVLQDFRPETIVHLAFVVNPMRDEALMHRINLDGTRRVLQAAADVSARRLLVSSSATALGGWPDNPVPMDDDRLPRPLLQYRYAHDKFLVEQLLRKFRRQHPGMAVSWTRPCIIYGAGVSNYLTKFILKGPLIALPDGNDTELQFVHLEDVARASVTILEQHASGPFNVAPHDWLTLRELARISNRRCVSVPFLLCRAFTTCWWALRLPSFHFPSGLWYFIRYPWVVAPARLTSELGFRFRYSSAETVRLLLGLTPATADEEQPPAERPLRRSA